MDKRSALVLTVLVTVLSLGFAGLAFAEGDPPSYAQPPAPCQVGNAGQMPGPGGMWGRGGPGMMAGAAATCPMGGAMHAAVQAALAQALGLTPEEWAARRQAGQTPAEIAAEQGLTAAEWRGMMQAAHAAALEQLAASGDEPWPGWGMARPMHPGRGPMLENCPRHAYDG
jgi:hypothetical protein